MNKDFRNYNEAKKYADEIRNNGLKSYIEEFYDFNGRFYTVLVWNDNIDIEEDIELTVYP